LAEDGTVPPAQAPVEGIPGLLALRPTLTPPEQERQTRKQADGWGRLHPDSVLVAAMGNHWIPSAWQRVADMVTFTLRQGIQCGLQEMMDRCHQPYDGLGTMRNEAILMAMNEGFEWLCYVDDDIMPEPDTLLRLLNHQLSVIAPYMVEPGTGKPLHGPSMAVGSGLHLAKWTVLSMLLFRVDVFNCTGPNFWRDALGADEGYHFQLLFHYGHRLFIDTAIPLQIGKRPLYPLSYKRMLPQERMEHEERLRARLAQMPDRRPIDPDSPLVRNGVYMPFAVPPTQAEKTNGT
jgi:hypothetical protein